MTDKQSKKPSKAAAARGFDIRSMLAALEDGCSHESYRPKGIVFRQGDAANAVFYIEAGGVQICVVSEQGKEGVIGTLGAGEFLGEGCLAGQPLHLASAIARHQSAAI